MRSLPKSALLTALLLVSSLPAAGQLPDKQSPDQKPAPSQDELAGKYFTDTELIDQDGKRVKFYSDMLKGKVVVINCFFATCTGSCLPMTRNMAKVQELLSDHIGKDVFFISISVDPEIDTPTRLKQYATTLKARPGWSFLTGSKVNVDFIHHKLGQYVEDKNSHNNILVIGNLRTGLWKKAFGLAKAEEIHKVVESVMNDRGTPAGR